MSLYGAAMDAREALARDVFAAWSSGDADAPERFFAPDAVLSDVASGRFEGWPAIRAFFAGGLQRWGDLLLEPDEFWSNDNGVAVHYVMSATVTDPSMYGAEVVGRRWEVGVMSSLVIRDGRVVLEVDHHDRGARRRSLGLDPWVGLPPAAREVP